MSKLNERSVDKLLLPLLLLAGLGLRLLVWQWREFYPLGGDEREYLDVALTILQERRYSELLFMRPPLYPIFLAGSIALFDSLIQNLRLVQALLSTATIVPAYLLGAELARLHPNAATGRAGLAAAALFALSYTLAANAAELLAETLFLFGLTAALWLLLRAGRLGTWRAVALAGLAIGAISLVRSVGLPLLGLGAVWLVWNARGTVQDAKGWLPQAVRACCTLTFACCIVVLPWTARNYLTYGGLILIDTTGAENLWLDNDPAGREAVKAQLFALGEDRLARQRLGAQRGLEAITADPARFIAKAGGELRKLFALEHFDDMLARPAIWVPPAEVWLRLLLGDGLWLLILLAGSYGMVRAALGGGALGRAALLIFLPWCGYILISNLVFHVELRYRLPVYPALIGFSALLAAAGRRSEPAPARRSRLLAPLAAACAALTLVPTLLHAPYPALAWGLAWKHLGLARAAAALARGDAPAATAAAAAALARDPGSALARVALARAELLRGDRGAALAELDAAIAAMPAHPQAHLLRGDLLRAAGEAEAARAELAYETGSLQDLQRWAWERFVTPPPAELRLGDGLDLGFVAGAYPPASGERGFRWSAGAARLRLAAPAGAEALLLRLASGRPDGSATPLEVWVDGRPLGALEVAAAPADYRLPLPADRPGGPLVVELRGPTFLPRAYDPASPDGRRLGVQIFAAAASP